MGDWPATERERLRAFYAERNFFASADGVLKVLSILAWSAAAALWSVGGACSRPSGAAGGAASGAALLLLCVAHAARLARHAPYACFYTDVVVTAGAGGALLALGALTLARCGGALALALGVVAMVGGLLALGSAAAAHGAALRRPARPAPRRTRGELDV